VNAKENVKRTEKETEKGIEIEKEEIEKGGKIVEADQEVNPRVQAEIPNPMEMEKRIQPVISNL